MLGKHCIKGWAKTQAIIAKSSAESELYSVIKGSCEGLGLQTLLGDLGIELNMRLYLDATAAKGILERSGISKIRHIDVNNLWLQEQCARKVVPAIKVDGTDNPADLLTKHLNVAVIERHLKFLDIRFQEGRSQKAAKLHEVSRAERQAKFDTGKNISGFNEKRSDRWNERGENQQWVRAHSTSRRALFTPYKIPHGPGRRTKLMNIRTTEGTSSDGARFIIKDDWTEPSNSHRLLATDWVGQTTFTVDPDEDIDLGGDCRRQRSRTQPSPETPNRSNKSSTPKPSKVSWADLLDSDDSDV